MSIGLKDLDERVAAAFAERVEEIALKDTDDAAAKWTETERRIRAMLDKRENRAIDRRPGLFFGAWGAMAAVWGGAAYLGWAVFPGLIDAYSMPGVMHIPGYAASLGGAYGVTKGLGAWLHKRAGQVSEMGDALLPEEVRAIAPLLTLSRTESLYLEVVVLLLDLGGRVEKQTGRDILRQMNDLVENSRQLEAQRADLMTAMGQTAIPEIEAERADLARRLEQAKDPVARRTLEQSVAICAERLNNARALSPALERLDAQQEVIFQTLASVQSTLGRLKVAPAPLTAPDVEQIKQAMSQINRQAYAVEQAVAEVMGIKSEPEEQVLQVGRA